MKKTLAELEEIYWTEDEVDNTEAMRIVLLEEIASLDDVSSEFEALMYKRKQQERQARSDARWAKQRERDAKRLAANAGQ
jgi:hypothetical protein